MENLKTWQFADLHGSGLEVVVAPAPEEYQVVFPYARHNGVTIFILCQLKHRRFIFGIDFSFSRVCDMMITVNRWLFWSLVPSPVFSIVFFNKYSTRCCPKQKSEAQHQYSNCSKCFHFKRIIINPFQLFIVFCFSFSICFTGYCLSKLQKFLLPFQNNWRKVLPGFSSPDTKITHCL